MGPLIRHNTLKALQELCRRKDKPLYMVIADIMEEHGLIEWLKVAAKFNVKETRVEGAVSHRHDHVVSQPVSETDKFVSELLSTDGEKVTH